MLQWLYTSPDPIVIRQAQSALFRFTLQRVYKGVSRIFSPQPLAGGSSRGSKSVVAVAVFGGLGKLFLQPWKRFE